MLTFILRRLLSVPLILLGVALITFLLLRLSPGDFFQQMKMDPSKSGDSLLEQKESAGLLKQIKWAKVNDGKSVTISINNEEDGPVTKTVWEKKAESWYRNNEPVDMKLVYTEIPEFEHDGDSFYLNKEGVIYTDTGAIEGFFHWIARAATGDFGASFANRRPVNGLIFERMWNTLGLSICALVLAWGVAIPLGVFAAVKPNSKGDYACSIIAFLGLSIPSVFFALLMILFASYTGLFPIGDMRHLDYDQFSTMEKFWDRVHHLVLPTIVIGTGAMAQYMRQARGNMVEALSQDYVRTAKAKGLPHSKVWFKHALRNAINPLVTLFGYSLAALLSGSFLVEYVMNWPGMATLVVNAITQKDEPVVMASVLVSALLLVAGNLFADLLLAVVDPRVRLS